MGLKPNPKTSTENYKPDKAESPQRIKAFSAFIKARTCSDSRAKIPKDYRTAHFQIFLSFSP